MHVLKKSNEKSKKFISNWEKINQRIYEPTQSELLPSYVLVDKELIPVLKEVEQYDQKTKGVKVVKIETVFTSAQINHFKEVGEVVTVITDKDIEKLEADKKAFEDAISKARLEGYNQAKKTLKLQ